MSNTTKTRYGLYIEWRGVVSRFPVNPLEELEIEYPTNNKRYNILDIGGVVVPQTPELAQISWSSFFPYSPDDPYVQTSGNFRGPDYYENLLQEIMFAGEPARLVIAGYNEDGLVVSDVNMQVVIDKFNRIEKAGETGDYYYDIRFLEYRDFTAETVNLIRSTTTSQAVSAAVVPQREVPKDQIVVGDNVLVSGRVYYTSYGDAPSIDVSNRQTVVTRIINNPVSGQNFPILIGGTLGWVNLQALRKA